MSNRILSTDSYKMSHHLQYPPGTTHVVSYIEARGGGEEVTFFGLRPFLEKLSTPITMDDYHEASDISSAHGVPFDAEGWKRVIEFHHGVLPLEISALPEGLVVPVRTPLVQVINTDPLLASLTSNIETDLLRAVWYPTTVATISREAKKIIMKYLRISADAPDAEIDFKLHDFGARGVSSAESAALGGMAHLVNFKGSDTLEAIVAARRYYGIKMAGFSIPAAEHSTITSWGRAREVDAYRNMLKQFSSPGKLVAVVSDSYDIYNACEKLWGEELKEEIVSSGGTLVIRPDSGDPATVVLKILEILEAKFGTSMNTKGYKVLPPYLRLIQGDGVNLKSIEEILLAMLCRGYSASNIAFGMGGALLQKCDRDTFKFAMKACEIQIDGVWMDVYKDPITDSGKSSKRGRQRVFYDRDGKIVSARDDGSEDNLLETVWLNGFYANPGDSFDIIRERANVGV